MRRAAELVLVILVLAGWINAGTAEARMLAGSAMASMASDCPHEAADAGGMRAASDAGRASGKGLAFMLCCFGVCGAILADMATGGPLRLAASPPRPISDSVPRSGSVGPEPPPPRT